MKTPLISVILPAFNVEAYFHQTIQSILNQTLQDFEVIIVDDASTDNTASIIKTYTQKDKRIKAIYNNKNLGISSSRNLAASIAQGKYFALQDADDYSHPQRFANQVNFFSKNPKYGLVGTQGYLVNESGRVMKSIFKPQTHELIKGISFYDNCFINGSIMMKKRVFVKAGGYNTRLPYKTGLEDYELNARLIYSTKAINLSKLLYYHRQNPGGIIRRNYNHYASEMVDLRQKILKNLQKRGLKPKPVISVVISNRNYGKYLNQALTSVLNQTYNPIEVVVVDDASTDSSVAVVKKFQKHNGHLRLIRHEKQRGLSATRNHGIQHSFGQYIAFLDSDDWWQKNKLQLQLEKFSDPGIGLVYSHTNVYSQPEKKIIKQDLASISGKVFDQLCSGNKLKGSGSGVMVKRDVFFKSGWFKEFSSAAEDWDQWLRIAANYQVDFVPQALVTIRRHSQGMQAQPIRMIINTFFVTCLIPWYIFKYRVIVTRHTVIEYHKSWYRIWYLVISLLTQPIW